MSKPPYRNIPPICAGCGEGDGLCNCCSEPVNLPCPENSEDTDKTEASGFLVSADGVNWREQWFN